MSRRRAVWVVLFAGCAAPEVGTSIPPRESERAEIPREVENETRVPRRHLPAELHVARPAARPAQTTLAAAPRPKPPSLRRQLREARVPRLQAQDEESLRAVVDRVAVVTGLPLVVTNGAEDACFDAGVVFDLDLVNSMRAVDVLNLIERTTDGAVRWGLRHGAVIFTAADDAVAAARVVRTYDIRTLTFPRTDFIAPRIDRLRLLDDLEDDDGGGPFGGVGERVSEVTPEEVVDLIQEQVASETWSQDGVSIDHSEGLLIVVQTVEVQARVRAFLQQLGAF